MNMIFHLTIPNLGLRKIHDSKLICKNVFIFEYEIGVTKNIADYSQCPRTDLNKRFLPKPMTTTG